MRAGAAERDPERVGEVEELCAPLAHGHGSLGKVLAPAGTDLDLGGDQLPDQVLLERRPFRCVLQLLEAVRELERLGVEDGELLLDGDREVLRRFELLARERDLVLRAQALRVPHRGTVTRADRRYSAANASSRSATLFHDHRSTAVSRARRPSSRRSASGSPSSSSSLARSSPALPLSKPARCRCAGG